MKSGRGRRGWSQVRIPFTSLLIPFDTLVRPGIFFATSLFGCPGCFVRVVRPFSPPFRLFFQTPLETSKKGYLPSHFFSARLRATWGDMDKTLPLFSRDPPPAVLRTTAAGCHELLKVFSIFIVPRVEKGAPVLDRSRLLERPFVLEVLH